MQYINGERIVTPEGYTNRRTFMVSLAGLTKRYKEKRLLHPRLSNLCLK